MSRLLLIVYLPLLLSCAATQPAPMTKIEGVALESPSRESEENVMQEIAEIGANQVCLMPYAFMRQLDDPVQYDESWQWWGEVSSGIKVLAEEARAQGLSVFLKPHLWISHGYYTGDLQFDEDSLQQVWNRSYKSYLLHHARLAEEQGVDLLCIGTELCMQVNDEPAYWEALIKEIRTIYKGKLTYAANWDCYQDFPFWKELDYIGIDAYFPISELAEPDLAQAKAGWSYWTEEMRLFHDSVQRPILFTEYGYRSRKGSLAEPWQSGTGEDGEVSLEQQVIGYQALYESIWSEPWFAGGYLWKWHVKEHLDSERRKLDYTPQDKAVLEVIKRQYGAQFLKKEE